MDNLQILKFDKIIGNPAIVEIDAKNCQTLRAFYEETAKVMHFPDYFGFNLDSFDEMINDLSWIEDENLLVYFHNSDQFLINERNETKIITLLDLLDATCEEWNWFEEDEDPESDEFIPKKTLKFGFSESPYISALLSKLA